MTRTPLTTGVPTSFSREDEVLWKNIEFLAGNMIERGTTVELWDHLLFACGNWKRQGGARIRPEWQLAPNDWHSVRNPDVLAIPEHGSLDVESRPSWERLDAIKGLGLATTTTVLAALWPDRHAIMDPLALYAAVGWAVLEEVDHPSVPRRSDRGGVDPLLWSSYEWYRAFLMTKANSSKLLTIERPLFKLDGHVRAKLEQAHGRKLWRAIYKAFTWGEYADLLLQAQEDLVSSPS